MKTTTSFGKTSFRTRALILFTSLCLTTLSSSAQLQPVASNIYPWANHSVKVEAERETRLVFEGTCPGFKYLKIHVTTQKKGAKPRPMHANEDREEVLIISYGKARFSFGPRSAVLGAGGVALILPGEMQMLENVGDGPLTYYVMQYKSEKPMDLERGKSAGGSLLLNRDSLEFKPSARGGGRVYFNRPTAMCENFEMHVSKVDKKGPAHAPHSHPDNEIILATEGEPELNIDGKLIKGTAGDLYFISSGTEHNSGNGSDAPCVYFAFRWR